MKLDILKKVYQEKKIIGFRTRNLEWDELIIGFIVEINDNYFIVNEIDENGYYIGNTEIEIEKIISIVIDDRYQKRLSFINQNLSVLNQNQRMTIWKPINGILHTLNSLIKEQTIVTMYFHEEEYVTGIIIKYDETDIMIKNIGREGDEDGLSVYTLNEIIGIRYGGIVEQKIKLLYENKNKFY